MKHSELIRRLQISSLGLDAVDPLRLLVDDVIAALAQRTWVGLTDEEIRERWFAAEPTSDGRPASYNYAKAIEAKLKEKNHD